jgi:hypothetical protein
MAAMSWWIGHREVQVDGLASVLLAVFETVLRLLSQNRHAYHLWMVSGGSKLGNEGHDL